MTATKFMNTMMSLKEVFGLGVITGPDMQILEKAMGSDPGSFQTAFKQVISKYSPETITKKLDQMKKDAGQMALNDVTGIPGVKIDNTNSYLRAWSEGTGQQRLIDDRSTPPDADKDNPRNDNTGGKQKPKEKNPYKK
jgi:hypothetical protein